MIIDLGTGDGRAAVAAAACDPAAVVLAIDAAAGPMAEASRRAARHPRKGGVPNVVFLAAAAESLEPVLHGAADLVTVTLPWGSLLRGALGLDLAVARSVARLLAPNGRVVALVSVTPRDGIAEIDCLDDAALAGVAARLRNAGLRVVVAAPATDDEVAAVRSTWLRRLASDRARPIWRVELTRDDNAADAGGPGAD
ncbi:MAG: class I SAM-dependent methyltransferase [Chloroflexota bacterium]